MKQISLWTTAIVSSMFVIMVCIDQHSWKLLLFYATIVAVWMLLAWFWVHRLDLEHDIKTLQKGESPLKCRWIGTLVFFVLVLLVIIALVVWGFFAFDKWVLSV